MLDDRNAELDTLRKRLNREAPITSANGVQDTFKSSMAASPSKELAAVKDEIKSHKEEIKGHK